MVVVVVAWDPVLDLEPSDWIRYEAASVVLLKLVVEDVREMIENGIAKWMDTGYDPSDCFMTRRAKTTATMMMLLAVSYM